MRKTTKNANRMRSVVSKKERVFSCVRRIIQPKKIGSQVKRYALQPVHRQTDRQTVIRADRVHPFRIFFLSSRFGPTFTHRRKKKLTVYDKLKNSYTYMHSSFFPVQLYKMEIGTIHSCVCLDIDISLHSTGNVHHFFIVFRLQTIFSFRIIFTFRFRFHTLSISPTHSHYQETT